MTRQQNYDHAVNQRFYRRHRRAIILAARFYRRKNKTAIAARRKENYKRNKQLILSRNHEYYRQNGVACLYQKRVYRLRKMGLSRKEALRAIVALQAHRGACEICGRKNPQGQGGWLVDHNHRTKKFRGILCNKCNALLGFSEDCSKVLKAALIYLRERS